MTPTAPGREDRVMAWVEGWVERRSDLILRRDKAGNTLIRIRGRRRGDPVIAVAHTDHPGFVVTGAEGRQLKVEFRGGVRPEYFPDARLEFFDGDDERYKATLVSYDPDEKKGEAQLDRMSQLEPGDIGRWMLRTRKGGDGLYHLGHACDDLAGATASLAALDRARSDPARSNFGVLLTRAEEVGMIGAIAACELGTIPAGARILSIECSRSFPDSPLGAGPIVRVGDAISVFDNELTNKLASAVAADGLDHQRKLMTGGGCEATAFTAYGHRATGLCLALGNYHNMGHLTEVEAGKGVAAPMPETISLDDFHGLVRLLGLSVAAFNHDWDVSESLAALYEREKGILA